MGCGCEKNKKTTNKVKNIVQGWMNLLSNKYINDEYVKQRAKICFNCKLKNELIFCKVCGCYIPAKITVKSEECPNKYWLKVK